MKGALQKELCCLIQDDMGLPVSLMRLISPERFVMSAQAFLLSLLMWQIEDCVCFPGYRWMVGWRGCHCDCLRPVINETKSLQNMFAFHLHVVCRVC